MIKKLAFLSLFQYAGQRKNISLAPSNTGENISLVHKIYKKG